MLHNKERLKKLLPGVLLVLLVCAHFLAEKKLRNHCYRVPQDTQKASESLMKKLPDFMQAYFRRLQTRRKLVEELNRTEEKARRIEILYKLAGEYTSESKRRKLMKQIVDEAGHSAESIKAWYFVLEDWAPKRILDEYLAYVSNCDIRTHRQKVQAWQTGLRAIKLNGDETDRLEYLRRMSENYVCDGGLCKEYEYLWVNAGAAGDDKTSRNAKRLLGICNEMAAEEIEEMK